MVDRSKKRARVKAAFEELLRSSGVTLTGDLKKTPARAAELWMDHLLAGMDADPGEALGSGQPSPVTTPVMMRDVGVHLLCPHHLTVAFGTAHIAYEPDGRVVGFGALARLASVCSSKLALQEEVAEEIARVIVARLGAKAAVAVIEAVHPCHNVLHPRSHGASTETIGRAGDLAVARELEKRLRRASTPPRRRSAAR